MTPPETFCVWRTVSNLSLEAVPMLKPIAGLAAVGIVGFVLSKLLFLLFFPIVGMFIGFFVLALKVLFFVALGWLVYSLFRKLTDRPSEA